MTPIMVTKRLMLHLIVCMGALAALPAVAQDNAATASSATLGKSLPYYPNMTPEQRRGQEIWFKATMGTARHLSYVYQQRFSAPIDWHGMLSSQKRETRFQDYGFVQDPDCKPASADSYDMDVCPGDEDLLKFVGKPGYVDPACGFDDGKAKGLGDPCLLAFGTSTGAVGFRKFPNPRFDAKRWQGWDKWDIHDASIEPPFLFGTACGSCHVGYSPTHPPKDLVHPQWDSIRGDVGNDFLFNQQMFTTGFAKNTLYYQALGHVRAGTLDTSAVANDNIDNTGTINAIINFDKRPTFTETVSRWRRSSPDQPWTYGTQKDSVLHILKGGEDSVGVDLAIERVYVNTGECSEQMWQNNLPRLTSFSDYDSGQHALSIDQARRTCPQWSVLENRVGSVISYLTSRRPTDLKDAVSADGQPVGAAHLAATVAKYDPDYAAEGGVFNAGRKVFADTCARCHSSQKPQLPGQPRDARFFANVDFLKTDANGVRVDWLGNDERTDVAVVGTNRCRALHSNHGAKNIYGEFSSETYKQLPPPSDVPELDGKSSEGRGYYRNISLLSVWAHAPFMHNNGIGTEYCSQHNGQSYPCVPFSPTVEARLAVFEDSVHQLLYPESRIHKIDLTTTAIDFVPSYTLPLIGPVAPLQLTIPKGVPAGLLGSLDTPSLFNGELTKIKSSVDAEKDPIKKRLIAVNHLKEIFATKESLIKTLSQYSNCLDFVEDGGHTFGAELSDHEKIALIQFMKNF